MPETQNVTNPNPPVPTPPATTTPPVAGTPEGNGKDFSAEKFGALAKKEKAIVARTQELSAREKAIADREAKIAEAEKRDQALRGTAKTNPLEVLKQYGLDYKDITNYILNEEKPTADAQVAAIRDELNKMRQEQEAEKKRLADEAKTNADKQYQQVVQDFQTQINDFIETNKDEYQLTAWNYAQPLVYDVVQEGYNRNKKVMTIKQAVELVEEYLAEQVTKAVKEGKRFKDKVKWQEGETKPEAGPDGNVIPPPSTLNNSMSAGNPGSLSAATEADRIKRALAALSNA